MIIIYIIYEVAYIGCLYLLASVPPVSGDLVLLASYPPVSGDLVLLASDRINMIGLGRIFSYIPIYIERDWKVCSKLSSSVLYLELIGVCL